MIVADDFTGAMDTAVQFGKRGIPTLVTFGSEIDFDMLDPALEVVSIDINSRHDTPEVASDKVRRLVRRALAAGIRYIYKKTDSALRGNIGAELKVLLRETGVKQLPFIPAYPQNGRTTVKGIQYIDGIPLDQTPSGRDPFFPVNTACIAEIIHSQSDVPVQSSTWRKLPPESEGICVYDAACSEDMLRIAEGLKECGQIHVTAGCAGFAEFLADALELSHEAMRWEMEGGNIMIVAGSVSDTTIRQIARLKRYGVETFTLFTGDGKPSDASDESLELLTERVAREISASGIAVVEAVESLSESQAKSCKMRDERQNAKSYISRLSDRVCKVAGLSTMIVIGGDTLSGIMDATGIFGILPLKELLPGIALGKACGRELIFITKSGGFGSDDVLVQILRAIGWKFPGTEETG